MRGPAVQTGSRQLMSHVPRLTRMLHMMSCAYGMPVVSRTNRCIVQ